jgi:predicted nuclease of predicted toxin-antitoxin system
VSLELVIDMNLSPEWVDKLSQFGWSAIHWSAVGDPKSPDSAIMQWAIANRHTVFTHDLDFGAALALTHAVGPSVLQVRGQNILPEHMLRVVLAALEQHHASLEGGAIVVVEERKCRVRVLPL